MQLPSFNTSDTTLSLMQSRWAAILNPLLAQPLNNAPSILTGIVLAAGDNVINTKLGRQAQGWVITDSNAGVTVYRNAPFNALTLTLNSTGAATISLLIF
jgi:hypothetical protein